MAIQLEIQDGNPWYLSPNIWVIDNPGNTASVAPVVGQQHFLMAKVQNNGSTPVTNATVNFYWANPSIGVNRNTATLIGQSFISLGSNDEQDVLCLTPWVPEFVNGGHECLVAEVFHPSDPVPATPQFNVPTDRHVAQKNLTVYETPPTGFFHFRFENHNGQKDRRNLEIVVKQVPIREFKHLVPKKHLKLKEGELKTLQFTNSICPPEKKIKGITNILETTIDGFSKDFRSISGEISGEAVLLFITQRDRKQETGGLGLLIINS